MKVKEFIKQMKELSAMLTDEEKENMGMGMPQNYEVSQHYQCLFEHMANEHNIILTISEMDEIIKNSLEVVKNVNRDAN